MPSEFSCTMLHNHFKEHGCTLWWNFPQLQAEQVPYWGKEFTSSVCIKRVNIAYAILYRVYGHVFSLCTTISLEALPPFYLTASIFVPYTREICMSPETMRHLNPQIPPKPPLSALLSLILPMNNKSSLSWNQFSRTGTFAVNYLSIWLKYLT